MVKIASNSFGKGYECKKDWAEDCHVQCGDSGVVVSSKGNYTTAFFEAFPKNPDIFVRGEGKTIEEAEENAWNKLQGYLSCPNHEFERRGYTNGGGFCKHCGMFKGNCFEPSTTCKICGKPTYWITDKYKEYYCKKHASLMPYEDMRDYQKEEFLRKRTNKITQLNHFKYLEDREYYLEHNTEELNNLELFMKDVFKSLCNKMGLADIENADIKEKYMFAVKNCALSIDMFRRKHEYLDYVQNENGLIAIRFYEKVDTCLDNEDKSIYEKTGKIIYLFTIETEFISKLAKYLEKNKQ